MRVLKIDEATRLIVTLIDNPAKTFVLTVDKAGHVVLEGPGPQRLVLGEGELWHWTEAPPTEADEER